jgi:hypothetical protein
MLYLIPFKRKDFDAQLTMLLVSQLLKSTTEVQFGHLPPFT